MTGPSGTWQGDIVLDVRTDGWGLYSVPGSYLNRAKLEYRAVLELYDVRTRRTLATGHCVPPPLTLEASPNWSELETTGGQFVKQELAAAIAFCVRGFARQFLGIWDDATESLHGEAPQAHARR